MKNICKSCTKLPTVWLETPRNHIELKPRTGLDNKKTVYCIVEGFILGIEPQIMGECDCILRLNVSAEESCLRRFKRERRGPHQWQDFQSHYLHHVHAARQSWMPLVERNAARCRVQTVDVSGDELHVRQTVLRGIRTAEHVPASYCPHPKTL